MTAGSTLHCRHGGEQPSEFFTISARHPDQENLSEQEHLSEDSIKVVAADLWVRTEELRRFQKEGSSHIRTDPPMPDVQEKPIGTTERNKTLVIIAALCQEVGIDINAHGAVAAVARLTELLGAAVSADTVGRRFKDIPAALESLKT